MAGRTVQIGGATLMLGECREVLAGLPAESVHCCVTSPPYYGLRDYGIEPQVWGGNPNGSEHYACEDCGVVKHISELTRGCPKCGKTMVPACEHAWGGEIGRHNSSPDTESGLTKGGKPRQGNGYEASSGNFCRHCNAWRGSLGLEPQPSLYIAHMVEIMREVRRVLRQDGTLWLNLGSSYSSGIGSDPADSLNGLLKGGSIFFANSEAVAVAAHSVRISAKDKRSPDGILPTLFCSQGNGVEDRHKDFHNVGDAFTAPSHGSARVAARRMPGDGPDRQMLSDSCEHVSIIVPDPNAQREPVFAILGASGARARKHNKAALPVNNTDKPSIRDHVRWHSRWDAFAAQAASECLVNVNLVEQAVSLRNRPNTLIGLLCHFRVVKASKEKVTLAAIQGDVTVTVSDVRHLWFALQCGSIVPYAKLFEDASRTANALRPKQDLGMPWRVARALQEDGWILRCPIIWHKPNPMPESVTDRCTSAHEHLFMLTKSPTYYYDAEAIKEPMSENSLRVHSSPGVNPRRVGSSWKSDYVGNGHSGLVNGPSRASTRNKRSVWTVASARFRGAHFATFPPKLIEPCILAGSSAAGVCRECAAPWKRVSDVIKRTGTKRSGIGVDCYEGTKDRAGEVVSITTDWRPTCSCHAGDPVPATVLDPFGGAATTALVAGRNQRRSISIELSPTYFDMACERISVAQRQTAFAA